MTKLKILVQGWTQIPHSYSIVNCFQLIHLSKRDDIELYVQEMEYYRPEWNTVKKLVYPEHYNRIIRNLKQWQGEPIDVIYSITFPYNTQMSHGVVPKCVFYTAEFTQLDKSYFKNQHMRLDNEHLYFTSPSLWSSHGARNLGVPDSKNRIITHGVDTTIFYPNKTNRNEIRQKYKVNKDDILLINIGAMTQNKGIMLILVALNELIKKGIKRYKLLLKGTGDLYVSKTFLQSYFETLRSQNKITAAELDELVDCIIFTDKTLSYDRINDLFNASDFYISPYIAEGFNLTVLEALASGLPVIVPETGSTREYIHDIVVNGQASDVVHYIPSKVMSFSTGQKQNSIQIGSLVKILEHLSTNHSQSKHDPFYIEYIKQHYSWTKVVDDLVDYFNFITKT